MPQSTSRDPSASKKRKEIRKRLRFEVFKRDHFTCQYCGAQPPGAVLVADHVIAFATGGPTTMENLITACDACNAGKSDRPLGDRAIQPDADLMFLEAQQEAAELRRYREALADREAAMAAVIEALQAMWMDCSGLTWHPANHIVRNFLNRYSPEITETAILCVAPKVAGGYVKAHGDGWIRYMYGVANNLASELADVEDDGEEVGD